MFIKNVLIKWDYKQHIAIYLLLILLFYEDHFFACWRGPTVAICPLLSHKKAQYVIKIFCNFFEDHLSRVYLDAY